MHLRLLVAILLAAVLGTQHIASAQCSPQCSCISPGGSWSPMYRMLTSPPPSENDIVPRAPPRCSCGCSPRRLPPRLPARLPSRLPARLPSRPPSPPPNTAQQTHGISALSGVVVDSPVFQQVGPATVIQTPPAVYLPSPDVQGTSSYTCDTSSHIMTIPRKQGSSETFSSFDTSSNTITTDDDTPTVTYSTAPNARPAVIFSSTSDESPTTTYSTTPQQMPCQPLPSNSVMTAPQPTFPPPPPSPPQPMYFSQPAPLYASCPATLFYPATPAMTCPQPNLIYPAPPSYPSAPPTTSQSFTSGPSFQQTYSTSDNNPTTTYSMPQPAPPTTSQSFNSGPSCQQTYPTYDNTPTTIYSMPQSTPPTTSQSFTPGPSHQTYSTSDNTPTTTYSMPPSAPPTISQSFTSGLTLHQTYSNSDNPPATTYSMTPQQDFSCNAPQPNNFPPSQTFSMGNFQNTPSNTVTFSTSDTQQTPTNSGTCTTNSQPTPSTTIFFRDSDSTVDSGTLSPETMGPTVTTHDAPLTYTLLTSGTNNAAMDANRDCSVPVPPVLV